VEFSRFDCDDVESDDVPHFTNCYDHCGASERIRATDSTSNSFGQVVTMASTTDSFGQVVTTESTTDSFGQVAGPPSGAPRSNKYEDTPQPSSVASTPCWDGQNPNEVSKNMVSKVFSRVAVFFARQEAETSNVSLLVSRGDDCTPSFPQLHGDLLLVGSNGDDCIPSSSQLHGVGKNDQALNSAASKDFQQKFQEKTHECSDSPAETHIEEKGKKDAVHLPAVLRRPSQIHTSRSSTAGPHSRPSRSASVDAACIPSALSAVNDVSGDMGAMQLDWISCGWMKRPSVSVAHPPFLPVILSTQGGNSTSRCLSARSGKHDSARSSSKSSQDGAAYVRSAEHQEEIVQTCVDRLLQLSGEEGRQNLSRCGAGSRRNLSVQRRYGSFQLREAGDEIPGIDLNGSPRWRRIRKGEFDLKKRPASVRSCYDGRCSWASSRGGFLDRGWAQHVVSCSERFDL